MALVPQPESASQPPPQVEAVLSFFSNASLDVDLSGLNTERLMNCVGKHCEQLSKSCTTLKHVILKLRGMDVTLEAPDDMALAIQWIRDGYEDPPATKVVKQYANALKGFLRMPPLMIPENPILTGTLPKWMFKGDEVDVFHQETESAGVWWHAVIIDDMPKSAKLCWVYWVGWKPCDTGNKVKSRRPGESYHNPTCVNRDDVRSHISGKCSAGSVALFSVAWIREKYCVVQISEEEVSDTEEQGQGPGRSESDAVRNSSGQGQELPHDAVSDHQEGSTSGNGQQSQRQSGRIKGRSPGDGEQPSRRSTKSPDKLHHSTQGKSSKPKQVARKSTGGQGARPSTQSSVAPTGGQGVKPNRSLEEPRNTGNATSRVEDFFWATLPAVTNSCIATLELLAAGKTVHPDVEKEGVAMLTSRCQALHKLYGNAEFLEFGDVAVESLASYEGKENSYARKFMVGKLRQFGFVISPRMWSKLELLMLMVIMLEPELQYMGIRQKDRQDERDQNRGMAYLPERVQDIISARLREYNCSPSESAPSVLDAYGGVVICSNGCYKSLHNFKYLKASLFEADLSTGNIIFVEQAPALFCANGPYIKTKDVFNEEPVYVQLFSHQVAAFSKCLQINEKNTELIAKLKRTAPAAKTKDRDNERQPRILVKSTDGYCIQSVTAYRGGKGNCSSGHCGFHVLSFKEDGKTLCFKSMPSDWTQPPEMQACQGKRTVDVAKFSTSSQFFFDVGSRLVVFSDHKKGTEYKPKPTRNQQFHTDGPLEFAAIWDKNSNLVLTGDPNDFRDLPVPDAETCSRSALMAFFSQTILGTASTSGQSLQVNIPLGCCCLFRFDWLHHGWRCMHPTIPDKLLVHFRAHFYLLRGSLRELPIVDFESLLEFLSSLSLHPHLNDAARLMMLDNLQTFVPYANMTTTSTDYTLQPLRNVAAKRKYTLLESQSKLDNEITKMRKV